MTDSSRELFISVDVEADGPCPGLNSMLSFGAVALDVLGNERGFFTSNLEVLKDAHPDPDTMRWWQDYPEAWRRTREKPENPVTATISFCKWIDSFKKQEFYPVMVAMPAGFDFTYMYYYMMRFNGSSPLGFSCIDIKSMFMAFSGKPFYKCTKKKMPKEWFPENLPHTHVAIDDAREQGQLFVKMLQEIRK